MALLLRDREATPEAAPPPPGGNVAATAPDFACETCGAAMERGQDWCLECGSAAPGRLGARPGWRAAFTVVGLTTLLLCCGVVAAYAALTSDAQRTASAPPAGSGDPITAQAPGTPGVAPAIIQPGATGPGVTPPATPPAQGTPIIPTTKPPTSVGNTPIAPPPKAPAPPADAGADDAPAKDDAGRQGSTGSAGNSAPAAGGPVTIAFKKGAAQTYDPNKRPGAEFGPAALAIDSKPDTVWDVTVPADGQPIGAGLVIDLGKPYALRSLRLATPTDGFTVEVYGAKSAKELPVDVIDKRWIHLTDDKSVDDNELILLKGKGDGAKVQLLLLHFTKPANLDDPRVAIADVTLRATP